MFAELPKEHLLVVKNGGFATRAMSRTDETSPQLLSAIQRPDPLLDVAVSDKVIWSVDACVAGKQNALVRKPGEKNRRACAPHPGA